MLEFFLVAIKNLNLLEKKRQGAKRVRHLT